MAHIRIFDTTLRDGEQSPGVALNTKEKLELAQQLARLGVDIIEAGFPIASEGDFEAVNRIAREVRGPVICGLARTAKGDIEQAAKALEPAEQSRIHIFTSGSKIHLEHMLKKSEDEVIASAIKSVEFAKQFCDDIEFSAQDCTRSDFAFLKKLYQASIEAGATTINIPDTVGYGMPEEYAALIAKIQQEVVGEREVIISTHCHDDLGLAVANSLAAIGAGAQQIECTLNGIGERAGNTSLEEVVMALETRKDFWQHSHQIKTQELYRSSRMVSSYTGMVVPANKAIVGDNAFSHEAGIHQDGVLKALETYEIMKAEDVGRQAGVLVMGKHSGRHAFRKNLEQLGYNELSDEQMQTLFKQFKQLADLKQQVTSDDIHALVDAESVKIAETYKLAHLQFQAGTGAMTPTALVRLATPEGEVEESATGSGPVDAAFSALRKITPIPFTLESYDLRAIGRGTDALGEVSIQVRSDNKLVHGRAISTDVVHASVLAYVDVLNKLVAGVARVKAHHGQMVLEAV